MRKYEYINIDIEWLSSVPKHWKVDRIKDHLSDDLEQINKNDLAKNKKIAHYSIPAFDVYKEPEICVGDSISSGKKVLKVTSKNPIFHFQFVFFLSF